MMEAIAALRWVVAQSPVILLALSVAALTVLLLPDELALEFGLHDFRSEYRGFVGAFAILTISLLVVMTAFRVGGGIWSVVSRKRSESAKLTPLRQASLLERAVCAWCLSNHRRWFRLANADPIAQLLIDKGFAVATHKGHDRNRRYELTSTTLQVLEAHRSEFRHPNSADDHELFNSMLQKLEKLWDQGERVRI